MTADFFTAYEDTMAEAEKRAQSGGIKGMIISGSGRHFSTGADVEALAERSAGESCDGTGELPAGHIKQKHYFTFLRSLPFPVVSVVTGFCIGSGSEIAVNSHYRIIEKNARVGQPESTFGILPALGGVARTIDICGFQNAYELVMSGELIPADRAAETGWADIFTEKKQGMAEAEKLIGFIAGEGGFTPEKAGEFMQRYKNSKGA
jgi:enoyl-CoA hydratase